MYDPDPRPSMPRFWIEVLRVWKDHDLPKINSLGRHSSELSLDPLIRHVDLGVIVGWKRAREEQAEEAVTVVQEKLSKTVEPDIGKQLINAVSALYVEKRVWPTSAQLAKVLDLTEVDLHKLVIKMEKRKIVKKFYMSNENRFRVRLTY